MNSCASDSAQGTFSLLLKSVHRITGSLGSWLHRVAVNRSLDRLREDVARHQREVAYSAQTWQETNQWEDIAPAVDEALQSAADFYLDEPARRLLVPDMKAGTVTFVPLE